MTLLCTKPRKGHTINSLDLTSRLIREICAVTRKPGRTVVTKLTELAAWLPA